MGTGDTALYLATTGSRFLQHCSDPFARSNGLAAAPIEDLLAFHIVFTATCWETFVKLMPVKDVETARTGIAAYHVLTLLNPYLTAEARQYMHYLRKKYLA